MSELTERPSPELFGIAVEHEVIGHPEYVPDCYKCKAAADLTYVPTPKPLQGA